MQEHTENHADDPTTWWTLPTTPNPTTSQDAYQPAPSGAMLRFSGIGDALRVSFDGGEWEAAILQDSWSPPPVDHFASFWMPVPAGTTSVEFDGEQWYGGSWLAQDASFWSEDPPAAS